jgi:hypothetical protein
LKIRHDSSRPAGSTILASLENIATIGIMNKAMLLKSQWKKRVRFRPVPQRYDGGPSGAPLPPTDPDGIIGPEMNGGLSMYQVGVPYGFVLGYDHIREYLSDPVRGADYGFLILKVQVNTGGDHVWIEPLLRAA